MSSYPIQANSAISQNPQDQTNSTQAHSTQANRPASDSSAHVMALPQDTVTLSAAARAQPGAETETHPATNATPNKPAPPAHANLSVNSTQKR